jgi:hypothetical protein
MNFVNIFNKTLIPGTAIILAFIIIACSFNPDLTNYESFYKEVKSVSGDLSFNTLLELFSPENALFLGIPIGAFLSSVIRKTFKVSISFEGGLKQIISSSIKTFIKDFGGGFLVMTGLLLIQASCASVIVGLFGLHAGCWIFLIVIFMTLIVAKTILPSELVDPNSNIKSNKGK